MDKNGEELITAHKQILTEIKFDKGATYSGYYSAKLTGTMVTPQYHLNSFEISSFFIIEMKSRDTYSYQIISGEIGFSFRDFI